MVYRYIGLYQVPPFLISFPSSSLSSSLLSAVFVRSSASRPTPTVTTNMSQIKKSGSNLKRTMIKDIVGNVRTRLVWLSIVGTVLIIPHMHTTCQHTTLMPPHACHSGSACHFVQQPDCCRTALTPSLLCLLKSAYDLPEAGHEFGLKAVRDRENAGTGKPSQHPPL